MSTSSLSSLRQHARVCRACPLWRHATQTVFGEGRAGSKVMLVGEQPGDSEDLQGRPFVGPAGRLLDRALQSAGIDRTQVYVTNAVKHFRWEARGKRRLHKKPSDAHIAACRPWLEGEIAAIKPRVIVCLGATAAQSLLGKGFKVTQQRGQWIASQWAPGVFATVHPSSLLRMRDEERESAFRAFVTDLALIHRAPHHASSGPPLARTPPKRDDAQLPSH